MKIKDFLSLEAVFIDSKSANKKQILEALSSKAEEKTGVDARVVFEALVERERLGTTGVGKGVALPHTRMEGLKKIYCAFARVNPVDFDAVDGKMVDLVFLLLVPEKDGADHLKALARLSRLLRDEATAESLRNAKDVNALYDIILNNDID